MAHIAILGLGNWGTAIARMWLADGHHVKGWTIEQEVYESITMEGINKKYLPNHPVEGMEATMHIEEALDGVEIVVLAVPSAVILGVVDQIIPPSSTWPRAFGLSKRPRTWKPTHFTSDSRKAACC